MHHDLEYANISHLKLEQPNSSHFTSVFLGVFFNLFFQVQQPLCYADPHQDGLHWDCKLHWFQVVYITPDTASSLAMHHLQRYFQSAVSHCQGQLVSQTNVVQELRFKILHYNPKIYHQNNSVSFELWALWAAKLECLWFQNLINKKVSIITEIIYHFFTYLLLDIVLHTFLLHIHNASTIWSWEKSTIIDI